MLILGLETSCDDTGLALVRAGRTVLSSHIASQTSDHQPFGGVVPEIAARRHLDQIHRLFNVVLAEAGVVAGAIDGVAVTRGPGLVGSLLVGASFAKGLAAYLDRPLIPVNHVHAHIHGALLGVEEPVAYPALALVASGGHTHLYRMEGPLEVKLLLSSVDDAAGECFDKVAKLLGLGYPGGPIIERLAREGDPGAVAMPRMAAGREQRFFSYSGLKTHVLYRVRDAGGEIEGQARADLCAAFQEEALGQLVRKTQAALTEAGGRIRSVVVAGGVAANQRFRELLEAVVPVPCLFPALRYCSDNGAMIAALGWHLYQRDGRVPANWEVYCRYREAAG